MVSAGGPLERPGPPDIRDAARGAVVMSPPLRLALSKLMSAAESTPSIQRILGAYRIAYVVCIAALSVWTLRSASADLHAEHAHAAVLAVVELIAALLFLFRRTQVMAAAALLGVFGIAAVI